MKYVVILIICAVSSCANIRARYHTVGAGDTLWEISRLYNVSVPNLKKYNPQYARGVIHKGNKVFIPYETSPKWRAEAGMGYQFVAHTNDRAPAGAGGFIWPVDGRVTSGFGRRGFRKHEGIDIAAPKGTDVKAARGGHVIYSGNRIRGYGNLVMVRHFDHFVSVYAHLNRRRVKKGQFVSKGQTVGTVGQSGRARGVHLHFEIRKGDKALNPKNFLRRQVASNM